MQIPLIQLTEVQAMETKWTGILITVMLLVPFSGVREATAQTTTSARPRAAAPMSAACENLKLLSLPQTTITLAEPRDGQPFIPQGTNEKVVPPMQFCRVTGVIDPEIRFEVWMPAPANWNGKFNGVGNGGLAGFINYSGMTAALARNYATASTDTGHQGGNGSWALGRPELLVDFASRGIHAMTLDAKMIIQAYYGVAPQFSYFTGCSGGGGQGLSEAQRYPLDYNGIVSGAPANYPTRMWPGELWPAWFTHKDPANLIPPHKLPMIQAAAIRACDSDDGVQDGIIRDPRTCQFDPTSIQCRGEDAPDCLTAGQAASVKAIYGGLKDPNTGSQFWPGFEPGSEAAWDSHIGSAFGTPLAYFKYFYLGDPDWDWKNFDMTDPRNMQLMYDADARLRPVLNSTDPDISSFKRAGGKLILYHGWVDSFIAPRNSIAYYESVSALQGGEKPTKDFFRLFMAPGMMHCGGGYGPNTFDALTALENWIEKEQPPASITASHAGPDGRTDRTRPLCAYPQVELYKGTGDINDAASFTCGNPK
jgi:feruloyl esterase